jgi:hypothetical protein
MSTYKTDQQHVLHRGRDFHFVSYEGQRADAARDQGETPPTWFLMGAGKRWAVMPQTIGLTPVDLHARLVQWLDENVFTQVEVPPPPPRIRRSDPRETIVPTPVEKPKARRRR